MSVLDILFPKRCLGCGTIGEYFCASCRQNIHRIALNESICPVCEHPAIDGATHPRCRTRYSPDGLTSFFRYEGVIRKGVKALKYRFVSDLGAAFVSLIPVSSLNTAVGHIGNDGVLVPIPLHLSRFRERGFNQAEVLGGFISGRLSAQAGLHMRMRTDMLRRTKKTTAQVDMERREDRLKNMEAVFSVDPKVPVRGVTVLLFDDVFTTGATMRSAANTLKRHGATCVWAVTMAR